MRSPHSQLNMGFPRFHRLLDSNHLSDFSIGSQQESPQAYGRVEYELNKKQEGGLLKARSAWNGRREVSGDKRPRDHYYYSLLLYMLPALFFSLYSFQYKFQSNAYRKAFRKCKMLLNNVSYFICLNRERVRRKRNPDSNSPNDYPTTFPTPLCLATGLLVSFCSQVSLFSNPSQPF